MSRQYASQLLFEVLPSKNYRQIVFVCVALATLSIAIVDVNLIYQILLLVVLMALTMQSLGNNKIRYLQWKPDGRWLIGEGNEQVAARLLQGSVVMPFFSSLKFKLENKQSLTIIIFKDSIDKEKFRQLRVRLKVEGIQLNKSVLSGND